MEKSNYTILAIILFALATVLGIVLMKLFGVVAVLWYCLGLFAAYGILDLLDYLHYLKKNKDYGK